MNAAIRRELEQLNEALMATFPCSPSVLSCLGCIRAVHW